MGFGFAAMIASPVMGYLIDSFGIANTFYIMGATYFVIMLSASLYLERPPEGYHPSGIPLQEQPKKNKDYVQLTANEAVKTRRLYILFAFVPLTLIAMLCMTMSFTPVSCSGGGFSAISAYIADLFGTKQLGAIHGYILTAWALACLVGPFIVAKVFEATQSNEITLYIFVAMFVVALIISLLIRADIRKIKRESELNHQTV